MQERNDENIEKVDERILASGICVEYFCSKGGPSKEECMEHVLRIAADDLLRSTQMR